MSFRNVPANLPSSVMLLFDEAEGTFLPLTGASDPNSQGDPALFVRIRGGRDPNDDFSFQANVNEPRLTTISLAQPVAEDVHGLHAIASLFGLDPDQGIETIAQASVGRLDQVPFLPGDRQGLDTRSVLYALNPSGELQRLATNSQGAQHTAIGGAKLTQVPDVQIDASIAVQLVAADPGRHLLLLRNLPGSEDIRVGDANVAADRGHDMGNGSIFQSFTQGEVWAIGSGTGTSTISISIETDTP